MNSAGNSRGTNPQENKKEEFSTRLLRPLMMMALATLLLVVVTGETGFHPYRGARFLPSFIPYFNAAGETISNAIGQFQGLPHETGWHFRHTQILFSIVIGFAVGPTLFFLSLRRIALSAPGQRISRRANFGYVIGGSLMMVLPLVGLEGIVTQHTVFETMRRDTRVSENRDRMIGELVTLGYKAQELWSLPIGYGGCEQRWTMMPEGSEGFRPLKLSDLTKNYKPQSGNYFLAAVEDDTSLTLIGVGTGIGNKPEFENWNGARGKIQVKAEVTPRRRSIDFEN